MNGFSLLLVAGIFIWLFSKPGKTKVTRTTYKTSKSTLTNQKIAESGPKLQKSYRPSGNTLKDGFQPEDRCTCGGTWAKWENSETGGRFFSCSRYPNCKKTRDAVLKEKLGEAYSEIYCSRGHHKPTGGTVLDPGTGKTLCKKCINKGYVSLRSFSKNEYETEKCRNGHLRTSENTYIRPDGSRECRICRRNLR